MFYTAESTGMGVSGILSLVCLGLYMTKSGRTQISSKSEEQLHHVWQYLGYFAETMIFLLAGVIIVIKVFIEDSVIHWSDYPKCLALYFFLHVIRFGVIFAIIWPMNKMGYGLTWREGIVLGYSGLRGAVSLTLALVVKLDHDLSHHIQDIVLFHTAGIAILTLVINGTTIGYVVRALGMMRMPEIKKKMVRNLIKIYRKEVHDTIENLKEKKHFGRIDWDKLKELAGSDKIREKIFKVRKIDKQKSDLQASANINAVAMILDHRNNYTEEELYIEAKHRYLTSLKGIYWEFFEQGQCDGNTVLLLVESAARAIDHEVDPIKDFTFIESYFHRNWFDNFYMKLQRTWIFKFFLKNWLYSRLSFEYDATVNYIEAHEECMEQIEHIIHHEPIVERLRLEIRMEMMKAENRLYRRIEQNFPEITKAIQHKRGGHYLLNHMHHFVEEMVNHGQMEPKEAQYFFQHLHREESRLLLGKLNIELEHADDDLNNHSQLSKIFTRDEIDQLCNEMTEMHFPKGEVIIKKDKKLKYIYYISKGIAHEKAGEVKDTRCPKIRIRPGDLIGLQFLGKDTYESYSNCYAKTDMICRAFPIASLRKLIKTKEQEIQLWCYVGLSIMKLRPDQFSKFHELNEKEVKALFQSCDYKIHKIDEEVRLENGGILIEGEIQKILKRDDDDSSNNSTYFDGRKHDERPKGMKYSYSMIFPTDRRYIARSECRIFHLPESLRDGLLSPDSAVFREAFQELPKVKFLNRHNLPATPNQHYTQMKTELIGIPPQLAHEDPISAIGDTRMALVNKFGRGGDKSIAGRESSVSGGRSRANSIALKGLQKSAKVFNMEDQEDDVDGADSPYKLPQLQKRHLSAENHPAYRFNTEEPMVPMAEDNNENQLSVIESSQSSHGADMEAEEVIPRPIPKPKEDNA